MRSGGAAAPVAALPARRLTSADAAIFEATVVPRYLSMFGEPLVERLVPASGARVCHLHCRTGYPDRALLGKLPGAQVFGCDASEAAIALARAKASATSGAGGAVFDYRAASGAGVPFSAGAFSHAFTLHPLAAPLERRTIFAELARVVAPGGQVLVATPLRGSFVEIADLLRECALKYDLTNLTSAIEAAVQLRPTDALLREELERAGFEQIDVAVLPRTLHFESGRAFFEDPVTRLMLLPEFQVNLGVDVDRAFSYVREAIDKYWSEGAFELTVLAGLAAGRRRGEGV